MNTPKQYRKKFISENHTGYYEKVNGVFVPKHVDRSFLDSLIAERGKSFEYNNEGWIGSLSFQGTRYFFELNYVNYRPLNEGELVEVMRRGDSILFDEELDIIWNRKYIFGRDDDTKFSQELMDLLTGKNNQGFRFREVEDKVLNVKSK